MIQWEKIYRSAYKSEGGRFRVENRYDDIHGDHWILEDKDDSSKKGTYIEASLQECRQKAEKLAGKQEK